MQKLVVIVAVLLVLTGCARNTLKHYEHAEYGVGNKDNPDYMKAATDCRNAEYSKGILVNGELVKDVELIEKYEDEYTKWMVDEVVKSAYSPGSGAYAGTTAAVAVTTGNTSNLNNSHSTKKNNISPTPEKYQDLKRSREARRNCLVGKGWKKPK